MRANGFQIDQTDIGFHRVAEQVKLALAPELHYPQGSEIPFLTLPTLRVGSHIGHCPVDGGRDIERWRHESGQSVK